MVGLSRHLSIGLFDCHHTDVLICLIQSKLQLEKDLSTDLPDHHRRQVQEDLVSVEREITEYVSVIQRRERLIQVNERYIAEIRGRGEERQRKEGECRVVTSYHLLSTGQDKITLF